MSYTTMYKFGPTGTVTDAKDFSNAHGSAPRIWESMFTTYLGWTTLDWVRSWNNEEQKLWDLYKQYAIPMDHRVVLVSTFDRATVDAVNFERLADAFDAFDKDLPAPEGHANHLPAIAATLRGWSLDKEATAAAWNQTSVAESFWSIWDEEADDGRSYNLRSDSGHFEIFAGLEAFAAQGAG